MENYYGYLKFGIVCFTIYFFITIISMILSMWFIFKKEKIKPYYSIIPFVNVYYYLKICKLPFWTFFIPGINIIVMYCSSYKLCKRYGLKKIYCYLSIFLPVIFLPIVAFGKYHSIYIEHDDYFLKNSKDIDNLEKSLEEENKDDIKTDNEVIEKEEIVNEKKSIIDEKINQIQSDSLFQDELVYDDDIIDNKIIKAEEKKDELKIEKLDDNIYDEELNNKSIDVIDDKLQEENKNVKELETNNNEYIEEKHSDAAIAFGGQQTIEYVDSVQTKNDELKCKRCGSSLVGANGYCPGCGIKI